MKHHIVVLGGGTGGTLTANRLRRMYPEHLVTITVVDQDDEHVYQPGPDPTRRGGGFPDMAEEWLRR
jgi:NADH dehydrogenase FAD-containing subunit